MTRASALLSMALLFAAVPGVVFASIAPLTPEMLEEQASLIVTGEVLGTYVRHEAAGADIRGYYVAEIRVADVEKGDLPSPGQPVYARLWNTVRVGERYESCGPGDYFTVPDAGDRVRVWLETTPNGYQVVYPNGVEVLSESPEAAPPVLVADDATLAVVGPGRNWVWPALSLLAGLVVGVPAGVAVASRRRSGRMGDETD